MAIHIRRVTLGIETKHIRDLHGSRVFSIPQLGHDLVVITEQDAINLGRIISVMLEDGSGRTFIVKTTSFPSETTVFVRLAEGIDTPLNFPQ